jgi:hypothetical protein
VERGESSGGQVGQTTAYVTQTDGYLQVRNEDHSSFRQCQGSGVIRYVPYDPDPAFSNKFGFGSAFRGSHENKIYLINVIKKPHF